MRGYEVSKGRYATVEEDELDEVQKEVGEGERVIEILQFVDPRRSIRCCSRSRTT